jgi:CDP-diacylglycerol--serine O-phosphatidyltransferase
MIVPALLMVSTIRYRSFKSLDLQARRSYPVLFLLALGLALLASSPRFLLLAMAYVYLASAFIGLAWHRLRRRPHLKDQNADDQDLRLESR